MRKPVSIRPDILAFAEMMEIRLRIHDAGDKLVARAGLEDDCQKRSIDLEMMGSLPAGLGADLAAHIASLALVKFLQHHDTQEALDARRAAAEGMGVA